MIADTAGVGAALEVRPRNNGVANPGPEGPGDAVAQGPLEMQLSRGPWRCSCPGGGWRCSCPGGPGDEVVQGGAGDAVARGGGWEAVFTRHRLTAYLQGPRPPGQLEVLVLSAGMPSWPRQALHKAVGLGLER
jgi:hypothetical protein